MKKSVFIGIDVSKATLDVSLLIPEVNQQHHGQFTNAAKGFRKMLNFVGQHAPAEQCLLCLEDTGVYSLSLCHFLSAAGLDYVLESAYRIKHSMGIVRGKSDKTDAAMIARYAHRFHDQLTSHRLPSTRLSELKFLLAHRARLIRHKSRLTVTLSETKLAAGVLDISFILASLRAQIEQVKKQLERVNEQIEQLLETEQELSRQYRLLRSVPGVGLMIAAHVLAFSEGFTRFRDWRKFACYIGTAPFPNQSGTSVRGRTKISHIAHKRLKGLMTIGAVNTLKRGSEYRKYYERKLKEGKHHMVILNSIRNKLLSRMFAVVRRNTPYVALQM